MAQYTGVLLDLMKRGANSTCADCDGACAVSPSRV